ncbi:hypothetical protein AVEN_110321-1 [Araneus ventricosus]|uniref:Uncharacterized protein n=1 Tax=Araneus ventricosus TaxID=182803 RepID=A0A4Y2FU55_ARAVE|nr:hypothetical protein AVEN_195951-1 [Araneus ventricosus]GBM43975.1 hypothetical protein AVEN_110321-1 [Araneus ventricosus]
MNQTRCIHPSNTTQGHSRPKHPPKRDTTAAPATLSLQNHLQGAEAGVTNGVNPFVEAGFIHLGVEPGGVEPSKDKRGVSRSAPSRSRKGKSHPDLSVAMVIQIRVLEERLFLLSRSSPQFGRPGEEVVVVRCPRSGMSSLVEQGWRKGLSVPCWY